jgi:hypothetical protein
MDPDTQKHMDRTDPDPQHWSNRYCIGQYGYLSVSTGCQCDEKNDERQVMEHKVHNLG